MTIKKFRTLIVLVLLIIQSVNNCFCQTNKVERLTFSIIDTTKSKYEQAHDIYNWITRNIKCDVKAYLSGKSNNSTAIETLEKRKGTCSNYSLLFNEMCRSIGIESYFVVGYSKGTDYFKGSEFYRADHMWNVFRIDSLWFFADVTWGSGYLVKVPSVINKIKFSLLNIPYANTNYVFVKAPTDDYFNPSINDFFRSHLPLDPNWQISDKIITINQFENDSHITENLVNKPQKKIDNSFGFSEINQFYIEGLNGKKFNSKNDFDIAKGYLVLADNLNYKSTSIDKANFKTFVDCRNLYKNASDYILKYQTNIDSVFYYRLEILKKSSKKASKVYSSCKNEINSENIRFNKIQNELNNSSKVLGKRIGSLEKSATNFQKVFIPNKDIKSKLDSVDYSKVSTKLIVSSKKIKRIKSQIDTLTKVMNKSFVKDSLISIACLSKKILFNESVVSFKSKIDSEDNSLIFPCWEEIDVSYNDFNKGIKSKKANISSIQNNYKTLLENINLLFIEYNVQVDLLNKFYRFSFDSIGTSVKYNELQNSLFESYNQVITFSKDYLILINHLIKFNKDFNGINLTLKKSKTIVSIDYFVKFDNELHIEQKRKYDLEKKIIKNIKGESARALIKLDNKLKKYKENNNISTATNKGSTKIGV